MAKQLIRLEYRLLTESPLHCGTGLPAGQLDSTVARRRNKPVIPGSTIKGVLREKCEQIYCMFTLESVPEPHNRKPTKLEERSKKVNIVDRIFGSCEYPGRFCFDDAVSTIGDGDPAFLSRTTTSIDRITGLVKDKALFNREFAVEGNSFEGVIQGVLEPTPLPEIESENSKELHLLLSALYNLDMLGSAKSSGSGRITVDQVVLYINGQQLDPAELLQEGFEGWEYVAVGL